MAYLLRVGAYFWFEPSQQRAYISLGQHQAAHDRTRKRDVEGGFEEGATAASCSARTRADFTRGLHGHYRVRSAHRRFHKRSVEVPYENVNSRACLRKPGGSECGGGRNQGETIHAVNSVCRRREDSPETADVDRFRRPGFKQVLA